MRAVLFSCVSLICTPALATTYVVRPDGSGDLPTIQTAISVAQSGDVIELSDGTFRGSGNRDLRFFGKAVTLRSQSDDAERCIIDCEGSEADQHRGFDFDGGESTATVVQAITITGGLQAGC